MKRFHISYLDETGKAVREEFSTVPDRAYAALGMNGNRPGDLYVCRLTRWGTALIPLTNRRGKQARTNPAHAGLSKQGRQWRNQ